MSGLAQMYDLKNPEQAKEYLDKLGTEYRFQCYHEKLPEGCHRLGDHLEAFMSQMDKSRQVYEFNCRENKYGHSCYKLAQYCMVGRGGPIDKDSAKELFTKGCSYGYGRSCHNIGLMYYSGHYNTKKDLSKAAGYFEDGCGKGIADSCFYLSATYISGGEGFDKDMQKAFKFADKACSAGHMNACVNVSQMYARGEGVQQDNDLAKKYKKRAQQIQEDFSKVEKNIAFGK